MRHTTLLPWQALSKSYTLSGLRRLRFLACWREFAMAPLCADLRGVATCCDCRRGTGAGGAMRARSACQTVPPSRRVHRLRCLPMPNGKPYDHPLTDITDHRLPVYTLAVDTLVAEIYSLGALDEVDREIPDIFRYDRRLGHGEPMPEEVVRQLQAIRDEAEKRVRATGWEPGPRLIAIREEMRAVWEQRDAD